MNEGKNPAPKGVYNCKLVGASRSSKSNHTMHYILSLRLTPQDCGVENVCDYFADLPMVFKVGAEFNFYDRETKTSESRKCTSADTAAAIEYARKCFPAWAEYCDALPDGSGYADAFRWFDDFHDDVLVRAAVKEPREFGGKLYYDATIYEQRGGKSAVDDADDFNAEFGNVIKAAGLKFGGVGKKATKTPKKTQLATAMPPAPPAPPANDAKAYTYHDSWNAYEGGPRIKDDPSGANYWSEVEKIVGKPVAEYMKFTSDDWRKCVEAFEGIPF